MKGKTRGITLVALVITIIVLLILAGITINLTIGQRGILKRAQEAGRNYGEVTKREEEQLDNILNQTDTVINEITGNEEIITPQEPIIDISALKAGDYIKYDTGVEGVGIIICRVLYPVDSPYGLQIISDKNVQDVELGEGATWEEGKNAYNEAIEKLNQEAYRYVNLEYAYDGRTVGSIPTVENGMFVDKNKVRDNEANIRETLDTITLPLNIWNSYKKPTGWTSDDTGCYDTDTNYEIDEKTLREENMWITKEHYWLASRIIRPSSGMIGFAVRNVDLNGELDWFRLSIVQADGNAYGRSSPDGLRPCISLKSSEIQITKGEGTMENPYIIGK